MECLSINLNHFCETFLKSTLKLFCIDPAHFLLSLSVGILCFLLLLRIGFFFLVFLLIVWVYMMVIDSHI